MKFDEREEKLVAIAMADILREVNRHFLESEVLTKKKFNDIQEETLINLKMFRRYNKEFADKLQQIVDELRKYSDGKKQNKNNGA